MLMCVLAVFYNAKVSYRFSVGGRGITLPQTPDAVSPRQYPSKNALMAPSARSNKVGLNEVSKPCHSLRGFRLGTASAPAVPSVRCRCRVTPRPATAKLMKANFVSTTLQIYATSAELIFQYKILVNLKSFNLNDRLNKNLCTVSVFPCSHRLACTILLIAVTASPTIASLLPHCERLMLASRRASSLCMVVFPAAPSFRCRRVATTRLQPFGKGKRISPTPHGQRTLLD